MIFLDLPNINGKGTPEQQLAEIRSYIYKNNEQTNAILSNLTIDKIWEQTASAVSSADQGEDETPKILRQYQRIRDLIIKTADVVVQSDEKMEAVFNGSYLAKSQFGDYLEKTKLTTTVGSKNILEMFDYSTELTTGVSTDLNNYKSDFQNYIKRGLLDNTGATPIYGIEVGLLSSSIDVDGQSIPTGEKFRTRITPDEMSFWEGSTKVAYLRDDAIYFPAAGIKGGSININDTFMVSSAGVMTALSGRFEGDLSADKIKSSWNNYNGNRVQLNADRLEILDGNNDKSFYMNSNEIKLYRKDNNIDQPMGEIGKSYFRSANPYASDDSCYGIEIGLRKYYGQYFSVKSYNMSDPNYSPQTNEKYEFLIIPTATASTELPPSPFNAAGLYINTTDVYVFDTANRKRTGYTGTINGHDVVNGIIVNSL